MGKLFVPLLVVLSGCYGMRGSSSAEHLAPNVYEVSGRSSFSDAREVCPYGWDVLSHGEHVTGAYASTVGQSTFVNTMSRRTTTIRCDAVKFCPCEYGYECVASRRYPGRFVCSVPE
jgi:hypothetical protein